VAAAPEACAGCSMSADVDQKIVDFAVSQLQGGDNGKCKREVITVENFQSQVVAGTLYKFDLVLKHDTETEGCSREGGQEERCHVQVYDVPWQQLREVTWDKTTCERN